MYSGTTSIRVILGYAPQEADDEAISFFNELELEIKMCVENGEIIEFDCFQKHYIILLNISP